MFILASGCDSAHYGGAPEPSFNVDDDLKELADHFSDRDSIEDYYENVKKAGASAGDLRKARDKFIMARLTMMNIRYIQFIRESTAERQLLDSAVDILGIGLNVAGVSFDSASTKTALAAAAAGVSGSKATIDKNFYFEETIPALVAAMNAQRKKVLAGILEGMALPDVNDYPFEQAVTDLHSYYFAGTFIGAIHVIQTDAGVKEGKESKKVDEARAKIRVLGKVKKEQVWDKTALTEAIWALGDTDSDLKKVNDALRVLHDPNDPNKFTEMKVINDAKERLQHYVRTTDAANSKRINELKKVFINAQIIKEE
jgi:hypothetical protein